MFTNDQRHRLFIQATTIAWQRPVTSAIAANFNLFNNTVIIFRLTLLAQEIGNSFNLAIIDKGAMHANNPAATFHKQHITPTKKLFGALFTKDRPAVDPRRDLKAYSCWEIRLDCSSDHID